MDTNYNSQDLTAKGAAQGAPDATGPSPAPQQGAAMQPGPAQDAQVSFTAGGPEARDSEHIYFSPGEPLTPRRPAPSPEQASPAPAAGQNAQMQPPAPEPYRETPEGEPSPHFTNTRITGADAERIIKEAAESDRRQAAATADRSLFANVSLNRGATPVDPGTARRAEKAFKPAAPSLSKEPIETSAAPGAQDPVIAPNASKGGISFTAGEAPEPRMTHDARRHPARAGLGGTSKALMSALLCIRQLAASFFTHTILGILFPRAGLLMGPCYPSSMPVPFFVMGFVTALPIIYLPSSMHVTLAFSSAIAVALFILMNGVAGFRGIASFLSAASRTRTGGSYEGAVSASCIMLLWASLAELGEIIPSGPGLALSCGAVFMLSALAGCTLSFGTDPDPVDSYGTMGPWGLLFSIALTLAALYLCLPPLAATSFFGLALLMRLGAGIFMSSRGMLPSRELVNAVQMLCLIALVLYMTAASALRVI